MRKVIGGAFISLDGVVQAPGGPEEDTTGAFAHGGWIWPVFDEAVGHQVDTLFAGDFDLLLGRRTYDIFAAYWPFKPDDDPIAAKFAKAQKYVLTQSDAPLDWQGSHRLADLDALAKVKAEDGPDLVIQGSATIAAPSSSKPRWGCWRARAVKSERGELMETVENDERKLKS